MRTYLWNWFKNYFKKEISEYVASFKEVHYREVDEEKDTRRVTMNYPIGQKVIVRSNEPDDLFIGKVVNYMVHEKSNKTFLIIEDSDGKQICPLDRSPSYWTQERENALRKLNWAEQWNVMSKYYDIDISHQQYKESDEYQNRNKMA
jgi:hypothetical protein